MRQLFKMILVALMVAAPGAVAAQTEHGFKPIAVEQDFNENGFNWFRHALLLAAGNERQSNAMTIGWGASARCGERLPSRSMWPRSDTPSR